MPSQARRTISLFRTIVLIAVTALWIASAALPAAAQNSVPASAVEAAKTPEGAARLAHPTRRAGVTAAASRMQAARPVPPANGTVYDNGPINGMVYAWTINFGYQVSDSFTLSSADNDHWLSIWRVGIPGRCTAQRDLLRRHVAVWRNAGHCLRCRPSISSPISMAMTLIR